MTLAAPLRVSERRPSANRHASDKPTKRQRDEAEARRLGISIEQLMRRRQAEAAANQALHDQAVQLGITVKELRRPQRTA